MKCLRFPRFLAAMAISAMLFTAWAVAKETPADVATTPAPRPDDWWKQRQQNVNARVKQGHVDLVFLGDSITHGWENTGKAVWDKYYGNRHAVNLGCGGDQTQHVLWRLDHGNIDGISPKLIVVMIGTNNAGNGQQPTQVAAGVKAIVDELRTKLPEAKILLLAIFPRGADNKDPLRQINMKANEMISKFADNGHVFYLDIGNQFVSSDGTLSKQIMPDLLHPNAKGYKIWAKTIEPTVAKLMGEK